MLEEERERAIDMGRDQSDRELRKWRIDLAMAEKSGEVRKLAQEFSFKGEADLYAAIGYGKLSPKLLITRLVPPQEREKAKAALQGEKQVKRVRGTARSGVRVQGLTDVLVNFAQCCHPLPGDPITGFITRGRGVTVHKADCANLETIDTQRIVDVSWDVDQTLSRVVKLGVSAKNRLGLLAVISGVFSSNESDIVQASMTTGNSDQAQGTFMVSVRNLEHLTRIMNALKSVKGVEKVERLGS